MPGFVGWHQKLRFQFQSLLVQNRNIRKHSDISHRYDTVMIVSYTMLHVYALRTTKGVSPPEPCLAWGIMLLSSYYTTATDWKHVLCVISVLHGGIKIS